MYAIIEAGGRQWKVEPGTRLDINRLATPVGESVTVEQVLFAHDGHEAKIGRPYVEGAKVVCEVLEHRRGPKIITYHYRRRENWRKTSGHRQPMSRLIVKDILWPGSAPKAQIEAAARPAAKPRGTGVVKKTPTVTAKPRKITTGRKDD
ncbi:MAG: 50S ribosomal protein L21 [Candidatus Omnitrophica bacterium]|nr:50S ribosomal protein L21 [Candidatus Omnitrophota bacterium]